jgi:hypothetical protein
MQSGGTVLMTPVSAGKRQLSQQLVSGEMQREREKDEEIALAWDTS